MSGYMGYYIVAGILSAVGMIISGRLKSKFKKYAQVGLSSGMSGAQVAQQMLDHYNVQGVKIVEGQGFLSDHYNPGTKTVALSPDVYRGQSVAAAAVAAHEVGHAIQHDTNYAMLALRSKLVPVVKVASVAQQWLLMGALMLASTVPSLLLIAMIAFAVTTVFSFLTLPVEFDASKRALVYLDQSGIARGGEYEGAKDALWWAAMTYVAAALSALVILIYLALRFMGR